MGDLVLQPAGVAGIAVACSWRAGETGVFAKATIAVAGYWPRALWDPAAAKGSVAIDNHCADRI
jgi:hypothetical protein